VAEDLSEEIRRLNERIGELESVISKLVEPFQNAQDTARNYYRLVQILAEKGGLTPDAILPEVKDPISKEIVRILLDGREQNVSQITERVRSVRGTASRRIVREKLKDLVGMEVVVVSSSGSIKVYSLSKEVLDKWSHLLGIRI
jgi:DNA-binding transcriptional ArsR family regulator